MDISSPGVEDKGRDETIALGGICSLLLLLAVLRSLFRLTEETKTVHAADSSCR